MCIRLSKTSRVYINAFIYTLLFGLLLYIAWLTKGMLHY